MNQREPHRTYKIEVNTRLSCWSLCPQHPGESAILPPFLAIPEKFSAQFGVMIQPSVARRDCRQFCHMTRLYRRRIQPSVRRISSAMRRRWNNFGRMMA